MKDVLIRVVAEIAGAAAADRGRDDGCAKVRVGAAGRVVVIAVCVAGFVKAREAGCLIPRGSPEADWSRVY